MDISEAFFDLLMCESIGFSASVVFPLLYEMPAFFHTPCLSICTSN